MYKFKFVFTAQVNVFKQLNDRILHFNISILLISIKISFYQIDREGVSSMRSCENYRIGILGILLLFVYKILYILKF